MWSDLMVCARSFLSAGAWSRLEAAHLVTGQEAQVDVAVPCGAAAADAGLRICARARHGAVAHAPGDLRSIRRGLSIRGLGKTPQHSTPIF